MNDLLLDDIDNLVLSGKERLDPTGIYDISYYVGYIKEDIRIMSTLLKYMYGCLDNVQEETKVVIETSLKELGSVIENLSSINPQEDFTKSQSKQTTGYYQEHIYADFIEQSLMNINNNYSQLTTILNQIYKMSKNAKNSNSEDTLILSEMVNAIKESCSELGIHSLDPITLKEIFNEDPDYVQESFPDIVISIDKENTMKEDITLSTVPYSTTIPKFSPEGVKKQEYPITTSDLIVHYKQSYIQNKFDSLDSAVYY
jgi:hypothetical protein